MSDNIRVVCRFRKDKEGEELDDWEFEQEVNTIKLRDKKFVYDEILDMNANQEIMYEKVAIKTIEDFTNGYHGTIFAYGNSGSGKTFSIVGPDEIVDFLSKDFNSVPEDIRKLYGVIPRATLSIFNSISDYISAGATVSLVASYIEIYNESIICLLNGKENLKIHEIPKVGFSISGKEERVCLTPEDVFRVIYTGTKNKTIGGTLQNARSSRSHTLLTLELKVKTLEGSERASKLNIVDLAGSEKLKNTGVTTPERLKEAQKINLSLTTLGMCIMALTENASFVPFRNSKLTLLLKESLGGNSKTTLLCAARRDKKLVEDNLNSLYFAQRAKSIKTKCVRNVKLSDKESEYLINALKNEIISLRKQVKDLGQSFKPFTDPKLLQFLDSDLGEDAPITQLAAIPIVETPTGRKDRKRLSLVNLSEDEIILKYCELRAKYDNLIQSAGNKIFDLTSQVAISGIPDGLEVQKKQYDAEIDRLTQKCEIYERENKYIKNQLNEKTSELDSIQEMLSLNQMDIDNMTSEIQQKNEELATLGKSETALLISLQLKDQEILRLESLVTTLKDEDTKSKLESQISNQETLISDLNFKLNQIKEELSLSKNKNEKLSFDLTSIEAELNNLKLNLSQEINNLQLKVTILTTENDQKQSWIESAKLEIENLRRFESEKISGEELLNNKDKLFNETKKILEERIDNLYKQVNETNNEYLATKAKLTEEVSGLTNELESAKKTNKNTEEELKLKILDYNNLKLFYEKRERELQTELTQKNSENNTIKLERLEAEKNSQTQLLRLEETLIAKSKSVNDFEAKLSLISQENEKVLKNKESEFLKDREDYNEKIKRLESHIIKLEEEIKQLNITINLLKNKNNIIENDKQLISDVS